MTRSRALGAMLCAVLCALPSIAQLQLNTTVRSFTTVSGTPWVADIWSYTDPVGRDFALVCRGDSGFSVYEITNPTAPVFASSIPATGSDLKDVKIYQNYAYCVQQQGPVLIVDLTNPYAIVNVGNFSSSGHNGFVSSDGYYYYSREGGSPDGCEIWDLTNPTNPTFMSIYDPASFCAHDAYAENDRLYVHDLFGGTQSSTHIVDVTNKSNPVLISTFDHGNSEHSSWMYYPPGGTSRVLCACNETAGGHMQIFDVTNSSAAVHLSSYVTDPVISIHNPVVVGRYAYIAYYADYLRILDMANPAQPVEVGVYDPDVTNIGAGTFDGAWGVAYVRPLPGGAHRLVLTESFRTPRGFWVIDFAPPPTLNLDLNTSGTGDLNLQVSGADGASELYTLVSANATQPLGAGPLGGLQSDAFLSLTYPLGVQPFHVNASPTGTYSLVLPPATIPPGLKVDVRAVALVGGTYTLSQIGRITF